MFDSTMTPLNPPSLLFGLRSHESYLPSRPNYLPSYTVVLDNNMLLSSAASAIIAGAVGLASYANALAPDDPASFAFNLSPVDDLGAQPSDECFYDVTIPDLLDIGFKQYAWVPWSQLSNESLAIAPHGAFVYKTVNGTLDYQKITNVDVLSNGADLVFGEATPFMSPAQTFEDVTLPVAM